MYDIGPLTSDRFFQYDDLHIKVFRGMFAGRVRPFKGGPKRYPDGTVVPSWLEMFDSAEEAKYALGHVVLADQILLTIDGTNVRLAAFRARADQPSKVAYRQIGKVEGLLKGMPARFSWLDLKRAKSANPETRRMHETSLCGTLYGHLLAETLEYIPNDIDPSNASFRKLSPFLSPRAL